MTYFARLMAFHIVAFHIVAGAALQAQETPPTDKIGLWEGTIGDLPIRVCFDRNDRVPGTYYYLSQLKPIALQADKDGDAARLIESAGYDKPTGGAWQIKALTARSISGHWTGKGQSLPISLNRALYTESEFGGPCEAPEFLAPRMAGAEIEEHKDTLGAENYISLIYRPGKPFDPDSVEIQTFALLPQQQGDPVINAALRKIMPDGQGRSDFAQCMGMMHLAWGTDGDFSHIAMPEVISARWVGVINSRSVYCGGAHPSHWQDRQIFDRASGKEIDPALWFRSDALEIPGGDYQNADAAKQYVQALSPALLSLVEARWPADIIECFDDGGFYSWDIGLGGDGLVFKPNVPHAITPCAESITVQWSELGPHLSQAGQAVRSHFNPSQ